MPRVLFIIALLCLAIAAPALVLRSERATIYLAETAVRWLTPYRLTLVDPVVRPYEGTLRAGELHLYPAADDGPPFLSVSELRLSRIGRAATLPSLATTELRAKQVTVYVSSQDATDDPEPRSWLRPTRWLPARFDISQLHIVNTGADTRVLQIEDIRGQRRESGGLEVTAASDQGGQPLAIALKLSSEESARGVSGLDVEATLVAPQTDSRMELTGSLTGDDTALAYQLALDADYANIGQLLPDVEGTGDLDGHVVLRASLQGDASGFLLSDARLVLDNMPAYGIEAYGDIRYTRGAGGTLALRAAGELASFPRRLELPGLRLDTLGNLRASASIDGPWQRPRISDLLLRAENADGLSLTLRGRVDTDLTTPGDNALWVDVVGPSLAVLEPWLGEVPFDPGPFAAAGRLQSRDSRIALEDMVIEVGRPGEALLRVDGRADDVSGVTALGPDAIQGLSLALHLSAPDSARLGSLLHLPLPPGFSIDSDIALAGTSRLLQPTGGQLRMASSDIQVTLSPTGGLIRPFATQPLSGLRAQAALSMSDTSALSQFTPLPIPSLGTVSGTGLLVQSGPHLALRDIDLSVTGEEAQVHLGGSLPDLATLSGTRLLAGFSGLNANTLLSTALQDLAYTGPLGTLKGSAELTQRAGLWDLSRFSVMTESSDGPLNLQASGSVADLSGRAAATGRARYTVRDAALLQALSGLAMKPLSGTLDARSGDSSLTLTTRNRVGRTRLDADAEITLADSGASALRLAVSSDQLHLEDLGLQAGVAGNYRPADQIGEDDIDRLLQRLLTVSPRLSSDVTVRTSGIRGSNTEINSLDLHTTGENNRYTLRRLNIGYGDTVTELRGIVDLNAQPPFVSIAGKGPNIPLRTLGRDLGLRSEVGGRLTLLGGLSAQGASLPALLGTVDGSLAIALEDGVFEGAAYDMLATDLLGWLFSGASRERLTHIDCSMARFTLADGVARSDSLYVETPQMVATGSGTIDLVKQRMDVELTPRSRTRSLQVPSTVRLKGPLDEPRVSVSPVAAAIDASAELLSLVPRLARRLFGGSGTARDRQPCEATG